MLNAEPDVTVVRDADIERTVWKITLPETQVQVLVASAVTWSHGTSVHLYPDLSRLSNCVCATIVDEIEAHAVARLHASSMAKIVNYYNKIGDKNAL